MYTSKHFNDIDLDEREPEEVFSQDLDHFDIIDF